MKSLVPSFLKKKDDKYTGARTSMKLDSGTVIPFIDLLETAVRKKAKSPSVSLKLLDNKQTNEVIDNFTNGFRNRISLDKNDTNVLWSAAIKIIKMSDPIFSDRNCTSLQTANAQDVSSITSFLPAHHQQLLGALLSASEMMIRIDSHSASLAADTLSSVLIWNSAPGSLMNRHAFCNLINNQRHDFPYCHSFERKLNLTIAPLSSEEWIAILEITPSDLTTFNDRRKRLVEPIISDRVEVLDDKPTVSSLTATDTSIQNLPPANSSLVLADVSKISRANDSTLSALDISQGPDRINNTLGKGEEVTDRTRLAPKDTVPVQPKVRSDATTLQILQAVFQRCFITRDDLEDLRLRQIDLDEDYADLSNLLDALDEEMAPKELVSSIEYARLKSVSQGVVAWTEILHLSLPFLSHDEQEKVRKERVEFAPSKSAKGRSEKSSRIAVDSPLKKLQNSFDDDEIEEVQEKALPPKSNSGKVKDDWSKGSGYNSFDEDDTIEELPTVYESKTSKPSTSKASEDSKRSGLDEEKSLDSFEMAKTDRRTLGKASNLISKPQVIDSWESAEGHGVWDKRGTETKTSGGREAVRESVGTNSVLTDSMNDESFQDTLSSRELPRGQEKDKSLSTYYDDVDEDDDDEVLEEKKGVELKEETKKAGGGLLEDKDKNKGGKITAGSGVQSFVGSRPKGENDISLDSEASREDARNSLVETSKAAAVVGKASSGAQAGLKDLPKGREESAEIKKRGEEKQSQDEYGILLVDERGEDGDNKPSWKRRETAGGVPKKSQTFQLTSTELDSTLSTPTTSPVKRSVMELLYEYKTNTVEESKGGNTDATSNGNLAGGHASSVASSPTTSPRRPPSDAGLKKQLSSKTSIRSMLSSSLNLLAHMGESKEKKDDEESVMSSTDSRIDPNELNVLDRNKYLFKKAAKMSTKRQSAQSLGDRKSGNTGEGAGKEEDKRASGVLGLFGRKHEDDEAHKGEHSRGLFSKVRNAFAFSSRSPSPATRASLDSSSGAGSNNGAPSGDTQSASAPQSNVSKPVTGAESKDPRSSIADGSVISGGGPKQDMLSSGNDAKSAGSSSGALSVQQSILIEPSMGKPVKKRDWDTGALVSELTNADPRESEAALQAEAKDEDKEGGPPRTAHRPLPPVPTSAPPTLEEISGNMHRDIPTAQKRLSNPALRRVNSEQKIAEITFNAHSSGTPGNIAPDAASLQAASPPSQNSALLSSAGNGAAASLPVGPAKLDGRGLAKLVRSTYSMHDAQLFAPPALRASLSSSLAMYPRSSSPNANRSHVTYSHVGLPRSSSPMLKGSAVRFSVTSIGTQGEEALEEFVDNDDGEPGRERADTAGARDMGGSTNKGAERLHRLLKRSQLVSNVTQELIRIVHTGGQVDEAPIHVPTLARSSLAQASTTSQSIVVPRETIRPNVWQQLLAIQQKAPWRPFAKSSDSLLVYAQQLEEQSKQGELVTKLLQYKESLDPKSFYLTAEQIEEMKALASRHRQVAANERVGWRATKETKFLSKFPPSSHKAAVVTLPDPTFALKLFQSPSSLSLPDRKSFYSELHLAWGVRFSGKVKKCLPRGGFLRRYFVVVCNFRQNPNLIPPQSRFDLITPEYHLLEYHDCIPSFWGDVPIGFKRGYCLTSQLSAILTEARGGSKVGREFTLVFNNWGGNYSVPIEDKRVGTVGVKAKTGELRRSGSTIKSKSTPKSSLNRPQFLTIDAGGSRGGDEDSEDSGDRAWDEEGSNLAGRLSNAGAPSQTEENDKDSEGEEENEENDGSEKEDEGLGQLTERITLRPTPSDSLQLPSEPSAAPTSTPLLPGEQQSILQPIDPKNHNPVFSVTLRAPTPSERLQWTQVLESVAPKGTFVNTVHY